MERGGEEKRKLFNQTEAPRGTAHVTPSQNNLAGAKMAQNGPCHATPSRRREKQEEKEEENEGFS